MGGADVYDPDDGELRRREPMRHLRGSAPLAIVVAMLLAGCGSDDEGGSDSARQERAGRLRAVPRAEGRGGGKKAKRQNTGTECCRALPRRFKAVRES